MVGKMNVKFLQNTKDSIKKKGSPYKIRRPFPLQ